MPICVRQPHEFCVNICMRINIYIHKQCMHASSKSYKITLVTVPSMCVCVRVYAIHIYKCINTHTQKHHPYIHHTWNQDGRHPAYHLYVFTCVSKVSVCTCTYIHTHTHSGLTDPIGHCVRSAPQAEVASPKQRVSSMAMTSWPSLYVSTCVCMRVCLYVCYECRRLCTS